MFIKINNKLWAETIENINKNMYDIFFDPKYFDIFQSSGYGEAEAYLNKINNNFFFIPFLKIKLIKILHTKRYFMIFKVHMVTVVF